MLGNPLWGFEPTLFFQAVEAPDEDAADIGLQPEEAAPPGQLRIQPDL